MIRFIQRLLPAGSMRQCSLAGLLLCTFVQRAYAGPAPTCSSGPTPAVFTATAPSGSYTVSSDVAVGTLLTPWTAFQGPAAAWTCRVNKQVWTGTAAQATFSGQSIVVEGAQYLALPTSLAGVGLVIEQSAGRTGGDGGYSVGQFSPFLPVHQSWQSPIAGISTTDIPNSNLTYGMRFAFVKTGVMSGGSAAVSGQIARVGVDTMPFENPAYIGYVNISGSASFTVPTCRTPDVTVRLGTHPDSAFPSIGSRRGESGEYSDFSIDLTTCYAHTTSLSYSLHPLNGVVPGATGLMGLSPNSSARGVGIRLMDRGSYPIAFDTKLSVNLASGSRYILLRAAIERTGWETFAGGSVQGYVDFTLSYN